MNALCARQTRDAAPHRKVFELHTFRVRKVAMQMIISSQRVKSDHDSIVVMTALDAITRLEGSGNIAQVVLAGSFATDPVLAAFIEEAYPTVRIEREA